MEKYLDKKPTNMSTGTESSSLNASDPAEGHSFAAPQLNDFINPVGDISEAELKGNTVYLENTCCLATDGNKLVILLFDEVSHDSRENHYVLISLKIGQIM